MLSSAVPLIPSSFCSSPASVSLSSCTGHPSSAPWGQLLSPTIPDRPQHHQIQAHGAPTTSPRSRQGRELPFPQPWAQGEGSRWVTATSLPNEGSLLLIPPLPHLL